MIKLLRDLSPQLALAGIVALQMSCGDSSGPGKAASSIAANSSTTFAAAPGSQVAELPSVIVRDESGNPISGVRVTFSVTAGGGSITGANATSDASGIATVGSWTLGATAGVNTLSATTGSLPAITFTAQGADPCSFAAAHTLGSTTNGQLSASDCRLSDGSFVDFYSVTIPTAGTYLFSQTANFDTYLALLTSSVVVIGVNDDFGAANISTIKAVLPAGDFVIGANSYDPNITGAYSISSAASTSQVSNCEDVFVLPGITTAQSLQASDCSNGVNGDEYLIFLQAGQSITATMSSTAVDSYLEIFADASSSTPVASNDSLDGTSPDARITFAPTVNGFYLIRARSATAGATGAYTLTIQ
jgi:hypothetical protein